MPRTGDRVRLRTIPPTVERLKDDEDDMHTKQVFLECLGRCFVVRGIGTNNSADHAELWVKNGKDQNDIAAADIIWVEPDYLDVLAEPAGD